MTAVVVRGMGLHTALGSGVDACVSAMRAGTVPTSELALDHFDEPMRMTYYRMRCGSDLFDPARVERLLPVVVREAIDDAGLSHADIARMPVFVGSSAFSIALSEAAYRLHLDHGGGTAEPLSFVGFQHIADTVQRVLASEADTYAFNTACTAAANAIMSATRMIQQGHCTHALAVGVELANLTTLSGFAGLQLVADVLRPFDAQRGGIVLGEGIGAVVLAAADHADAGRLVVRAGAANIDTYSVTTANPDGSSIGALQQRVLAHAGVAARDIQGIKAHGTASPMNDAGEAAGIHLAFAEVPPVCALKPYVGHTLGACGVNEFVLMGGALRSGFFPATPGFEREDAALRIRPTHAHAPAAAGLYLLNYFGFGGHNTALLVEHVD